VSAAAERARVLEAVRDLGRATADDVSDAADLSARNARRVLTDLVGYGLERRGKGVKGDPHVFEAAA
jgi:predicted ArsR family transcriptional regulator